MQHVILPALETLRAEGMQLSGTLPTALPSTISELDISGGRNRLSGTISETLWPQLLNLAGNVNLGGNRLSGTLPSAVAAAGSRQMALACMATCTHLATSPPTCASAHRRVRMT